MLPFLGNAGEFRDSGVGYKTYKEIFTFENENKSLARSVLSESGSRMSSLNFVEYSNQNKLTILP